MVIVGNSVVVKIKNVLLFYLQGGSFLLSLQTLFGADAVTQVVG